MLISKDGRDESGAIIATYADHHKSSLLDLPLSLELEGLRGWNDLDMTSFLDNMSSAVLVLGCDVIIGIESRVGLNDNRDITTSSGGVDANVGSVVAVAIGESRRSGNDCVGRHIEFFLNLKEEVYQRVEMQINAVTKEKQRCA
jgi:hypothetical protein